jgi:hypothetical protein
MQEAAAAKSHLSILRDIRPSKRTSLLSRPIIPSSALSHNMHEAKSISFEYGVPPPPKRVAQPGQLGRGGKDSETQWKIEFSVPHCRRIGGFAQHCATGEDARP